MGVTIHFEGRLLGKSAYQNLLVEAQAFAEARTWLTEPIEPTVKELLRVGRETEEDWNYVGAVSGLIIYADEECDPIRLEFDEDFYVQEFVKTQFAGPKIHVDVVEFLRSIQSWFENLFVKDEGEYWDSGNLSILVSHMEKCHEMIESELKNNPRSRSRVKTADGRIIDLIT